MRKDNVETGLLIFVLFFQLCINYSCQNGTVKKISDKELSVIAATCLIQDYPINLYYLDGNCSFCLAKAKDFDDIKKREDGGRIIMFMTSNPTMTKLYTEGIGLQSCVILDSTNYFSKSFVLNSRYKISANGKILSEIAD